MAEFSAVERVEADVSRVHRVERGSGTNNRRRRPRGDADDAFRERLAHEFEDGEPADQAATVELHRDEPDDVTDESSARRPAKIDPKVVTSPADGDESRLGTNTDLRG